MSRECLYDPFKLESRLTRVYRRHGRNSCGPSDENVNGLGTAPRWMMFEMKLSGLVVSLGYELFRLRDLEDVLTSGFFSLSYLLHFEDNDS
jgi:hypothetical protein